VRRGSARGGTTDECYRCLRDLAAPPEREMDCCSRPASASAAPCCYGHRPSRQGVVSFTGSAGGIVTDTCTPRRDLGIRAARVEEAMLRQDRARGRFQGVPRQDVTTLGAAADTTGRRLAHALGRQRLLRSTRCGRCLHGNPASSPGARSTHQLRRDARAGGSGRRCGVRCVEYDASTIVGHVRSSFFRQGGTWVREEDDAWRLRSSGASPTPSTRPR